MEPLCHLLSSLLLLAAAAVQQVDAPSGRHDVPEQYNRLDRTQQHQWIRDLLGRLDRASRLVLPPGQAAKQQARHATLLSQPAMDPPIARSDLLYLLRQTDFREKQAIERLARRFRIRVYDTFRLRRDEFTRRRAAWDRTLASWQAAGSPFGQQHRLIGWLEAAVRNSTPGSVAPLPPIPRFDTPKFDPPELERLAPQTPVEKIEQTEPLPVQPEPVPVVPHHPPQHRSPARPAANHGPSAAPVRRPALLPLIAEQSAPIDVSPIQTPSRNVAFVPGVGPRRAHAPLPKIAAEELSNLLPSDRTVPLLPSTTPGGLAAPGPPLTTADRSRQPPSRSIGRPAALPTKFDLVPPAAYPAVSQSPKPHRVNLAELGSRIAGLNLTLQTLEVQLDENHGWNARRLGPLVDRLALLVIRRNDLAVFHELISSRERAMVGRLESSQATISQLAARIFQARNRAAGPGFIGTQAQRRAELEALDDLSRQLAEMASRK